MKKNYPFLLLVLGIFCCLGLWIVYTFYKQYSLKDTVPSNDINVDEMVLKGTDTILDKKTKTRCRHGNYKKLYSRDDPNHPRNRGYYTLDDVTGTSIKEGYTVYNYSPNLTGPFYGGGDPNADPAYQNAANQNSTQFYNNAVNNQNEVNHDECSKYCDHSSCCGTLGQAQQTTHVANIDFNANLVPSGLYQLFCSNTGQINYGQTILSVNQYNDGTKAVYNDCMYNQDQMVQNICQTASNNLSVYQNNIATPYDTYNANITNSLGSGTIEQGGQNWNQSHYQIGGILSAMQNSWQTCNQQNNQLLGEAINNCSNANTSLTADPSGILGCGMGPIQKNANIQCNLALISATNPLVNDTANSTTLNDYIKYNTNPIGSNPINSDPLQTMSAIETQLNTNLQYGFSVYNDCSNSNTRLDPNGVVMCTGGLYTQAYNTCQAAMGDASGEGDISGNAAITQYWNDVSNNLTFATYNGNPNNNVLSNVQTVLQNATQYCEAKIRMYNKWRTDEQIAAALPCIEEPQIFSQNTSDTTKYVDDWVNSSVYFLDGLNAQLDQILADLSGTGITSMGGTSQTILQLTNAGIQTAPYGALPIFTITGLPLNQTLNLVIPSGAPGPSGLDGTMPGPIGKKGNMGIPGTTGNPGIWEVPVEYTNTFA